MIDIKRFQRTIENFDQVNQADPIREIHNEQSYPRALLYAQRMTTQLARFVPNASESLKLAARAQHIKRWHIPRSNYPLGREGYKKWRAELAIYHADIAGSIMLEAGYDDTAISRVAQLLQKKQLKRDAETQALEDVICLVFIEHYLPAFMTKHSPEKLIDIIRKTWKKMSPEGHKTALTLTLPENISSLIEKALKQ